MNQLYVYIYPLLLGPPSHHHPCKSSQSSHLSFHCSKSASYQPAILHKAVLHVSPNLHLIPLSPSPRSLCPQVQSILYVCVSIPALQLVPSVLFPGECDEIGNPLATLSKFHYVYICLYIYSLPSLVECTQ